MNRLLCDSLVLRLLLLVGVCVGLSIGLTWFVVEVGAIRPEPRVRQMADRIAGLAVAMEATPPALRDRIAAHASGPDYTVGWLADPPELGPKAAGVSMLQEALARARREPVQSLRLIALRPGVLALPLVDGSALVITPAPGLSFDERVFGTVPLTLLCLSALVVCLLAARRVSNGMASFAAAAEQFGRAGTTRMLPERGPREVREAIAAFNVMQARIERVMAERTAMLGALSHDLRTPLARLRLRAEFLAEPQEQARMRRDLDEMGAMVDQSLDFLRDDARAEPSTALDLAVLLQGLAEEQADLGHGVTFVGPDHATVRARPLSLKRALGNIVENAVKFGSRAEIELRMENGAAAVAVSDDGPGIPEALRERVFEPFYRAEASRNRTTGGVGLGLSIARAVVRAHGGEIVLSDHALGGLIVQVALPRAAV